MCSTPYSLVSLSILHCDHTLGRANLAQRLHFPDGTLGLREEDFLHEVDCVDDLNLESRPNFGTVHFPLGTMAFCWHSNCPAPSSHLPTRRSAFLGLGLPSLVLLL